MADTDTVAPAVRTVPRTEAPRPPTMQTGGSLMAIIPQSFEELQRIANTVIHGGLAPSSLAKKPKSGESPEIIGRQNIAAVATVLMAGAELGLPPMVALRSFTVINGKPALYADGNVAVVRKAKDRDGKPIAKRINCGVEIGTDQVGNMNPDTTFGWCEAERSDGETFRWEFSIRDAMDAGLWDQRDEVEKLVWENRQQVRRVVKNDAPWKRFWKRMLIWRATGYCLRWLFADVLGGMVDEYEARDMEGMVDITPVGAAVDGPPEPPPEPETDSQEPPPDKDEAPTKTIEAKANVTVGNGGAGRQQEHAEFLEELEGDLALAADVDSVEMAWSEHDVERYLVGDDDSLQKAFDIKRAIITRLEGADPVTGEIEVQTPSGVQGDWPQDDHETPPPLQGQADMDFPGDRPLKRPTK